MDSRLVTRLAFAALCASTFVACGQKGDLYLPDAPREVVTRPAPSPSPESTEAPNSPRTVDSPLGAPTPTPEVTAPAGTPDAEDPKKEKGAATTPPPPRK
jgi:predicted small lipoprotein YifL